MSTSQNPVTRLNLLTVEPPKGDTFQIICNLSPDVFDRLVDKWNRKTRHHTAANLIQYIRSRKPCICVTKEQYDATAAQYGGVISATKEEWEAENPGLK